MEDVVIVGGGIAGLATAVALKRVGIRALVLERSEVLRAYGAAITLFPNAWLALDALGVCYKLTPLYPSFLKGPITTVGKGTSQKIFEGPSEYVPRTIHRKALLEALAQELPPDCIRLSSKLVAIETQELQGDPPIAVVHLEDGTAIKSKILIGCDGVHSEVAHWLGLGAPAHSGRSIARGLAVFPEGHGFNQFRQFPDGDKRAGIIPINERETYWFFSFPSPPNGHKLTREPEQIQREIIKYAENSPQIFLDIVRRSDLSSLSWTPLLFRHPWDIIFGNLSKGNVAVAGDAMHPMTPDLAQGGGSALEDAVVLGRHIGNSILKNGRFVHGDMARALDGYAKERRWRAAALVAASYISGKVLDSGDIWWMRYFRDSIFCRYFFSGLEAFAKHDCGKLPVVPEGE